MCIRDRLEFSRAGLDFEVVVACGGGARSSIWLEIYADACGLPVQTTHFAGAPALGSAICAAVAVGQYASLSEAAGQMVRVSRTIEPRLDVHRLYAEYLQQYVATYPTLRENMHAMFQSRAA
jgi:sugar (pentulose or hexulose) kinase